MLRFKVHQQPWTHRLVQFCSKRGSQLQSGKRETSSFSTFACPLLYFDAFKHHYWMLDIFICLTWGCNYWVINLLFSLCSCVYVFRHHSTKNMSLLSMLVAEVVAHDIHFIAILKFQIAACEWLHAALLEICF